MDEYLILLLFLGILFVLFFYREEIFGKQNQQIIQSVMHKSKKNKQKKYKSHRGKKHRVVESESETENSESSRFSGLSRKMKDDESVDSFESKGSIQSNDTFPSIGSGLSRGNERHDDDSLNTF